MMYNHKFECFKLELSFILWEILGIATINISKLLYSNPYKIAVFCEYYKELRMLAKKNNIESSEKLNDKYLYEKVQKQDLQEKYEDVLELMNLKKKTEKVYNLKSFITNIFGINLYNTEEDTKHEKEQVKKMQAKKYKNIVNGKSYPGRFSPIKEKEKLKSAENINYLKKYHITSLIMLFFIFSFIGWIWEISLYLIDTGYFVNKGAMYGPWLPIYGFGSVFILTILYKFRNNPKLEFLLIVILCGVVEYFTSIYLEVTKGLKWWDYSDYLLNLNGRICAEGLLVFGLGGLAITYFIAPLLDNYLSKINKKIIIPICIILVSIFVIDTCYSTVIPNKGRGVHELEYYKKH